MTVNERWLSEMTAVKEYSRKYLSMDVPSETNLRNLYPRNIHVSAIQHAVLKKAKPAVIMATSMKRETDDKGLTHKHGTPYAYKGDNNIHLETDTCTK